MDISRGDQLHLHKSNYLLPKVYPCQRSFNFVEQFCRRIKCENLRKQMPSNGKGSPVLWPGEPIIKPPQKQTTMNDTHTKHPIKYLVSFCFEMN